MSERPQRAAASQVLTVRDVGGGGVEVNLRDLVCEEVGVRADGGVATHTHTFSTSTARRDHHSYEQLDPIPNSQHCSTRAGHCTEHRPKPLHYTTGHCTEHRHF